MIAIRAGPPEESAPGSYQGHPFMMLVSMTGIASSDRDYAPAPRPCVHTGKWTPVPKLPENLGMLNGLDRLNFCALDNAYYQTVGQIHHHVSGRLH